MIILTFTETSKETKKHMNMKNMNFSQRIFLCLLLTTVSFSP